jgi:hypothetical protein
MAAVLLQMVVALTPSLVVLVKIRSVQLELANTPLRPQVAMTTSPLAPQVISSTLVPARTPLFSSVVQTRFSAEKVTTPSQPLLLQTSPLKTNYLVTTVPTLSSWTWLPMQLTQLVI